MIHRLKDARRLIDQAILEMPEGVARDWATDTAINLSFLISNMEGVAVTSTMLRADYVRRINQEASCKSV